MIDSISIMAWSSRADGFVEFFGRPWLEYTGLSADEALGWGWTAAIHREDLERLTNRWRELLASGQPGENDARMRRWSGEYRSFRIHAEPEGRHQSDGVRWFATSTDIEDLKRAESLRAAEKQTLEMIADGASLKDVLNHLCNSIDSQVSIVAFARLESWPLEPRRTMLAESESMRRLEFLLSELNQYLSDVPSPSRHVSRIVPPEG